MKIFSTNLLKTSSHSSEDITDIGYELPAEAGGMTQKQIEGIWHACENLYRVGAYPMISMCIRRHGNIILNRAIGHTQASLRHRKKKKDAKVVTVETPVCLFSASKLVTAMLVHLAAERGLLSLDDNVGSYIPEYATNGKENTTIRHLLTHQAGIAQIPGEVEPNLLFDNDEILKRLCEAPAQYEPGSKTAYHALTAGYVLGEIMQRATGHNLRDFLAENIEKPLGLPFFNYGLAPQYRDALGFNLSTGIHPIFGTNRYLQHVIGGDLKLAVDLTNDPRFFDIISPSANIFTSAEQMSVFLQMLLNGGTYNGVQILKPETIQNAVKQATIAFDRTLLAPMRYGLGPMLGMNPIGMFGPMCKSAFGHIGFTNIFCYADPSRDISVSILTTGKPVIGVHYPQLIKLLTAIAVSCPTIPKSGRLDIFN